MIRYHCSNKLFVILLALLLYGSNVLCGEVSQHVLEESEIDGSLAENIVLYGFISELTERNTNVSATCAADLTNILKSINKQDMWAVKALDASGTYRGSFVWGQNAWIGSKRSCDFLNKAPKFTISPDVPKLMDKHLISTISPMEMDFKMIFLIIVSPYKVDPIINLKTANTHRLGLCLPKSCSNQDVERLSKSFFSRPKLKFQKLYNATVEVINVRNMDIENFLDRPEVGGIFFAICIVIALVVIFSFANSVVESPNCDGLKRFLKCFSIYDNVASIYNTDSSPNSINSINGIRSLICLWVLLIHCGFFTMYAYDNLPTLMASLERIAFQPIFAIVFYVDVFFVLSALLLVYNFLKDERTLTEVRSNSCIGNVKLFFKKIIHRYIRLTPAFIFTAGVGHILSIYIQESSSFYIDESFDAYCIPSAFWNSVSYIHNFFEVKDICISWSWYLACDMQFYVIILFILFVYARLVIKFVETEAKIKQMFSGNQHLDSLYYFRLDSIFHHLYDFYSQPWNRMHPYLAGCTVGYFMFQIKDKKYPENRYTTVSYWTVTSATIIGTLFLTSFKESSALNFALALSVGRYVMGVFAGSWVVMCHIGYGGIVNTIFSSRFFVHLNKVTYVMYLIHPILILFFNSTQESSPHYDVPTLTTTAFGIMMLSYIAAVIISPFFELPFQKLSDEFVMKKPKT
ncbi:hypothetical protein HA402_011761 [Bradysia odoriphaga]|nr:hypothetical protein HA402_011761 [Bradysia odoriphaga]